MSPKKSNADCIFCKIAAGEIPSNILYRDEEVFAFPDIKPLTPVHILVLPIKHITSLADMTEADTAIFGKMVSVAYRLAREHGIDKSGYRLSVNSGPHAGQLVPHLHIHLMGGRPLDWKH